MRCPLRSSATSCARKVVERAIGFAIDEPRPGTDATRRAELLAEIRRLDAELSPLTMAIASGGDPLALLAALKERQAQRGRCERIVIHGADPARDPAPRTRDP